MEENYQTPFKWTPAGVQNHNLSNDFYDWNTNKFYQSVRTNLPAATVKAKVHTLPTVTITAPKMQNLPEVEVMPTANQQMYNHAIRPRLNKQVRLDMARQYDRSAATKGRDHADQVLGNFNKLYFGAGKPTISSDSGRPHPEDGYRHEPYSEDGQIYNTNNYKDATRQLISLANQRYINKYGQRPSVE